MFHNCCRKRHHSTSAQFYNNPQTRNNPFLIPGHKSNKSALGCTQRLLGRGQQDCWPKFSGKSCREEAALGVPPSCVGEPLFWCCCRRWPYYIWAMAFTTTPQNRINLVEDWRDPKIALNTLLRLNPCTDFPGHRTDSSRLARPGMPGHKPKG